MKNVDKNNKNKNKENIVDNTVETSGIESEIALASADIALSQDVTADDGFVFAVDNSVGAVNAEDVITVGESDTKAEGEPINSETKANPKRYRIDKLLAHKDIKFRGPFSYRIVRIIGFLLMFLAQVYFAYNITKKLAIVPDWTDRASDIMRIISLFALPMFLTANFCVIMRKPKDIKHYLITYSALALIIYGVTMLVYFRYFYGGANALLKDPETASLLAETVIKKIFGSAMNYNVFIDLALFCLFYFFMFYKPKNIKSKQGLMWFRLCSIIPVALAIVSSVLYAMYYLEKIHLHVALLAILPCRSLTVYIVFFLVAILIKIRRVVFAKWGGTEEEYEMYAKSNRGSLEMAICASLILLIVCAVDFVWLNLNPIIVLYGLGYNYYMVAIIPFLLLLSYTRTHKNKFWDIIIPAIFFASVVVMYLETFLYIVGHLKIVAWLS